MPSHYLPDTVSLCRGVNRGGYLNELVSEYKRAAVQREKRRAVRGASNFEAERRRRVLKLVVTLLRCGGSMTSTDQSLGNLSGQLVVKHNICCA